VEPVAELLLRIERLEAEAAITRLSADYCHGADHRDLDLLLSVWADDAVWQVSDEVAFTGRDEIAAGIRRQWETTARAFHWTSNPSIVVSVDALSATARFDVQTQVELLDGSWLAIAGTYRDEYVRVDGVWRLARRAARVDSQRTL
jgi:ketosteroid isomerase-like protein